MKVTLEDLEKKVSIINNITNSPPHSQSIEKNKMVDNVGHYFLSGTQQGYCLWRNNEYKGGDCPITTKRLSKEEMYNVLSAYIKGIEEGIKEGEKLNKSKVSFEMLQKRVTELNKITGSPQTRYVDKPPAHEDTPYLYRDNFGDRRQNVDHYFLSWQPGSKDLFRLNRINEGGEPESMNSFMNIKDMTEDLEFYINKMINENNGSV